MIPGEEEGNYTGRREGLRIHRKQKALTIKSEEEQLTCFKRAELERRLKSDAALQGQRWFNRRMG